MNTLEAILSLIAVLAVFGIAVAYFVMAARLKASGEIAEARLAKVQQELAVSQAALETRQKELQLEGREEVQREVAKLRDKIENETSERRAEIKANELRLRERDTQLERRAKNLDGREQTLAERDALSQKKLKEAETVVEEQRATLERVAQLPVDQARELVMARVESESRDEMNRVVGRIEKEMREDVENRARKILVMSIQKCAVDQTSETSVSVVPLPSDDLKGRIIGREGRNIRAFEQLSGCDLIIDDTPEAVVVSCFEPMRREIGKLALQNLVTDGRIHPARIEEMLEKAKADVQARMKEAAEKATAEAQVRLPRALLDVFGRLLYRTSYGQNMLRHSVEVSTLAASIAAEIGADVAMARRAGLLHDIGKALDHDQEGTHIEIGEELLKRHRENEAMIRAAMEHHMDPSAMSSVEAVVVQIADAISSSRPGARRENVETYVKRLQNLEKIADSFQGVEKSFAIQAGREVRIVVKPNQIDDLKSLRMAREVAQRIQDEMTYPGEIKITVIRETRSVDYAR